ncbi:MAG: ribonuclease E/G, partial [Gammaproteobacteria bacterium]|nr:ribonuclease E/G [Gammaproteobacteria bacterium]
IDINSARATKGGDIEETALNTNLEAADEIARQLRIRDLGGLIVIDFIDMQPTKHQREVENRLRDALKMDRARVQIGRISRFGLLEMSRQRLRPSLGESSQIVCPRCKGQGTVRGVESLALSVLRIIEENAMKDKTGRIVARLPVEVATFLLNEKRDILHSVEQRQRLEIILIPVPHMHTPEYEIRRLRSDELPAEAQASYAMMPEVAEEEAETALGKTVVRSSDEPAVKFIAPPAAVTPVPTPTVAAAPAAAPRTQPGFIKRLWTNLFGGTVETEAAPERPKAPAEDQRRPRRDRPQGGERDRGDRGDRARRGGRDRDQERGERGGRDRGRGGEGRQAQRDEPRREGRDDTRRDEPRREDKRRPEHRRPDDRDKQPREPREPREPRGEQQRRGPDSGPRSETETAAPVPVVVEEQTLPQAEDLEATPGNEAVEGEQQQRGQGRSRRGRRGGRRRGGNRNREGGENAGSPSAGDDTGSTAESGGESAPRSTEGADAASPDIQRDSQRETQRENPRPPAPVFHETPRPFESNFSEPPRPPVSSEPPAPPRVESTPRTDEGGGSAESAPKPPDSTSNE